MTDNLATPSRPLPAALAWLRDPYLVDGDGSIYTLRYFVAKHLHALALRLYGERYECGCGAPQCIPDEGRALLCIPAEPRG